MNFSRINNNNQGFTLLELMVTLAIAAIIATMAIPSFFDGIRNNRLTTTNNTLIATLNLARSEAIKRGTSITVRKVDNNSFSSLGAGANWEDGWDVFTDANNNGNFDAGTDVLIKTYQSVPVNFTLRGNNNFVNFIRFTPTGLSNLMGSFFLCDNADGDNLPQANTSRLIIVNAVGRPRMATDPDNNGIPNTDNTPGSNITTCTPP